MDAKKKITKIELDKKGKKQRVAAYTRVSSNSEEQLHSIQSQTDYYKSKIMSMNDVIFAGVYIDEGMTGTRMDKREGFQKMMIDCKNNKIDRILTKSISRFARNILETLVVLRELKGMGVSVYFEQENIDTAGNGSEVILSIYSALAEMESKNISMNQRWGFRKRAREGIYNQSRLPYGYKRNDKKEVVIDGDEARIVEMIFDMYVNRNMSTVKIRKYLNDNHIGNRTWSQNGLVNMLMNERYCGDMLLQKKYTTDEFPYRLVRNHGDMEQYYVYDVFPKIVDREMLERSQRKIRVSQNKYNKNQTDRNKTYAFTSKVTCSTCGSTFKRRVQKGRIFWGCPKHLEEASLCPVKAISEEELKEGAISILCRLKENIFMLEEYLNHANDFLTDNESSLELKKIDEALGSIKRKMHKLHEDYRKKKIDFRNFHERYTTFQREHKGIYQKRKIIEEEMQKNIKADETLSIIQLLKNKEISGFDEELFDSVVDKICITQNEIDYKLKNDFIITIKRE